jgi:hypothetical protein
MVSASEVKAIRDEERIVGKSSIASMKDLALI